MTTRTKQRIRAGLQSRLGLLSELCDLNRERENELLGDREADVLDGGAGHSAASVFGALAECELRELVEIDAALAKLNDGSYGKCAACARPIDTARLRALPETPHCLRCASDRDAVRGGG